jgi:LmbE family N-acetylglucosaminyl deacetylase
MMTLAESTIARRKRKVKRRDDQLKQEQHLDNQKSSRELMEDMEETDDEDQTTQHTSNNQYQILADGDEEVEFELETETEEESDQAMTESDMDDHNKPTTKKKTTFEEDKNGYDSHETIKSQIKKSAEKKDKAIRTKERQLRREKKNTRETMTIGEALEATIEHGTRMKEELAKIKKPKNTTEKKT